MYHPWWMQTTHAMPEGARVKQWRPQRTERERISFFLKLPQQGIGGGAVWLSELKRKLKSFQLNRRLLHSPTFLVLCKCGAAGREPGSTDPRGAIRGCWEGRRCREGAGANHLWFSVSCWDLRRETGCSCGSGRDQSNSKYSFSPSPLFLISSLAYLHSPLSSYLHHLFCSFLCRISLAAFRAACWNIGAL